MKAILICPAERPAVAALKHTLPWVLLPLFGRNLLEYWLDHLAQSGATQIIVLTSEQPELVQAAIGNGARWGLSAEVVLETREPTPVLARKKYRERMDADWLTEPDDVIVANCFPGLPQHQLFNGYADWFTALQEFLPRDARANRIGVRELKPGVWVGLRSRIAASARLCAPCWVGEQVRIGPRSVVGPMSVVEDRALIESDCHIAASVVGPQTLVGKGTEVMDSLAWDNKLLNWKTGSLVTVPDAFLLCALGRPALPRKATNWLTQLNAFYARNKGDWQLFWKDLLMNKGG
jgi:NDP-sugar pyrophosphorylase family protein